MKQFSSKVVQASIVAGLALGANASALLYARPAQAQAVTYAKCANEWAQCSFSGTRVVRYGDEGHFIYKTFTNGVACRNDAFGKDRRAGRTGRTVRGKFVM